MKFARSFSLVALITATSASPIIETRQSSSANDLTNGAGCKAMTVIFARGTTETGNVGTIAGPPFFSALKAQVGANNVAVQGVDYPADIPGFLAGGDANGSKKMASLVGQAMKACPDSQIVMAGYRYIKSWRVFGTY
jgi:cutinase